MKAVSPYLGKAGSGKPQAVSWVDHADPVPGAGEVLIEVRAAALNRGDLLQMRGLYPPPAGASPVPGLEACGVITAIGNATDPTPDAVSEAEAGDSEFKVGDEVVALLAGGGQAERVAVHSGQLLKKPESLTWIEAGGLAEVALTSWTNLVHEGSLVAGQTVLITAAASGVGSYCVRLAKELGANVVVAGRKLQRLEPLRDFGAEGVVQLGEGLAKDVRELCPNGVDLVLDLVGGHGVASLLAALKDRGRLVLLGLMGGTVAEIPLSDVLRRRLEIRGSVLRARSVEEKAGLIRSFESFAASRWESGCLTPLIDRSLPFEQVSEAYQALATEEVFGKIVLTHSLGRCE